MESEPSPDKDPLAGPRLDDVTRELRRLADGESQAFQEVVSMVYRQLEELARSHLRRHKSSLSLDTRGLVHETYLKMLNQRQLDWQNRRHFFAVTSQAMRQVLVDHARRRNAAKRGSGQEAEPLEEERLLVSSDDCLEILRLDEALKHLAEINQDLHQLVEYRFFGGLKEPEIAEALGVSERTVQRMWKRARAWLRQELQADPG